ncbi:bacterial cell division membrane protein [Rubidibacter lacunae KORDI 51-2]|uniref:Probable peptidoglycan glycosyltransferase FtsW n=1 Tax=Rubidibacter lacunae KORDI 51-2 TaxID=582515 RepID=U5D5D5_9CHRO|nr:FtsW/RodA/SpoVE family cell cycle protein [Rubidibacter lacunae]ERN39893.1 bacterial cell division membrane protein [Rubidibacter lacunae KORDI 51-2]
MLRNLIPVFDTGVQAWALEARLLRWLTLLWLCVGLVVLVSASYPVAQVEQGDGLFFLKRQLVWAFAGLVGFNLVARSPLERLLKIAPYVTIVLGGLIFATKLTGIGTEVNGAMRWIEIGPISLQPSEPIKPFLVLQSAWLFGEWEQLSWRSRVGWLCIFALVLGGILIQPNLSTAALCGMSLWAIALAAGIPWLYLLGVAGSGLALATISISLVDYQRRRVTSFLDPWADPQGDGFQLVQSLLAIASGGTWGTRLGLSHQKLFYLPIQHTDFIFAVFAEEFGFAGTVGLLLLLMGYATLALAVALKARQPIHRLIAMGATIFLIGQALINIGVATGSLPTTGLPLPLFSYGGNSLIASLLLAGLLVRVARESNEAKVVPLPIRHRPQFSERVNPQGR